ncbi:HNH endonuclease signature motif containing protein [Nocardioides sp. LHG3406-4]|uniref:HNH endonuclease signature motif containing protein n=1 Tax=Nocardioides sp. LHG3406-4 TaxID=2804575 RepID=UPI003CE97AF1
MFECVGCGKVCAGRVGRKFCSNACQRRKQQRDLVEAWLATGQGYPASKRGHYVRSFLMLEQRGRCAVCDGPDTWCDRELVFVLDHIDGDADNNVRANLRLVCPNCDSQLTTYKNRNSGRGRYARRQRYASGQSY